jgi:membrane-bound lytic murein transglycosylase D
MQILMKSTSKYLVLAVLSCILTMTFGAVSSTSAGPVEGLRNAGLLPQESIWSSMRGDLTLDHNVQSSQVQAEIRKLLADQDKLYHILNAAAPYIYFIHQQTRARGLPAELALIPVVESEFNPNDHSTKGATGLWQLMPSTAHDLGVKVRPGYDGRRDVVASTKAALNYFGDLGHRFKGNWNLVIAAYNCGEGKIQSAERRTGSHSFWNLPLPRETRYYVPRLLAVAAIVKNPQEYGVQLPPIQNTPYFQEVTMKKPGSLAKVAKSSGVSVKTLDKLNPDYNHGIVAKQGTYTVLMPIVKNPPSVLALAESTSIKRKMHPKSAA